MAKKTTITCEVLTTIKGLIAKKPEEYINPGTVDKPTLVELDDNDATQSLIDAKAIRIWPGPSEPVVPETAKIKQLQDENADLKAKLAEAVKNGEKMAATLRKILESSDLDAAKELANGAL